MKADFSSSRARPPAALVLCCWDVGSGSSGIFGGRPGSRCGISLDCCPNTMPLRPYFTASFAFLPLPLNLLIFCPVLFPPLPPLIGPYIATCHMEGVVYNCSALNLLFFKFNAKWYVCALNFCNMFYPIKCS